MLAFTDVGLAYLLIAATPCRPRSRVDGCERWRGATIPTGRTRYYRAKREELVTIRPRVDPTSMAERQPRLGSTEHLPLVFLELR